jgi:hypothetical protein
VAVAGAPQTVAEGALVHLDGSGSLDSDIDPLTYSWRQVSGVPVALSAANSVAASFIAPSGLRAHTTLVFELTVNDGQVNSYPHSIRVNVIATNPNIQPVAAAGPDQTVNTGATVQLNGAGSSDANGDPLTYRWVQSAGPSVRLSNPNVANPSFPTSAGALYTSTVALQLIVNDGLVDSEADSITVTVTAPPLPGVNLASMASVTASSESLTTGQRAQKAVDGYADGYPTDATHEWATAGGRAGSWIQLSWNASQTVDRVVLYDRPNLNDQILGATLQFSDGSTVAVGALPNNGAAATYLFSARTVTSVRLTINAVSSSTQSVGLAEIAVFGNSWTPPPNRPPVAAAGSDQVVNQGATVRLDGGASSDPDGNPLAYRWTQVGGLPVTLTGASSAVATFTAPTGLSVDEVLTFELVVSDGPLDSPADLISVRVSATFIPTNVAPLAVATASSEAARYGQTAAKAIDGVADGYPGDHTKEWVTSGQRVGAWIQLTWSAARTIDRIVLHDRPNTGDQITAATVTFSDGTSLTVGPLPNNGAGATYTFPPRTVTSMRITVSTVSGSTQNVGLAEVLVFAR